MHQNDVENHFSKMNHYMLENQKTSMNQNDIGNP